MTPLADYSQAGTVRERLDPRRPWGWLLEAERDATGELVPVLTVFLVNRECPWRCVFCDLHQYTLPREVQAGDIPAQLLGALEAVRRQGATPRQIKLYNAGSFFDPRAIPPGDHESIADLLGGFERVIVECHPALVGAPVGRFFEFLRRASERALPGGGGGRGIRLEVAMGLETVNPGVLPRLGKGVTLEGFRRASDRLRAAGVDLRAFVLVQPPYEGPGEAVEWACRSVEFAIDCGACAVSLIPVRSGTSVLTELERLGEFRQPTLDTLERALDASLEVAGGRARVFADVWDLDRFSTCLKCREARRSRLERIQNAQRTELPVACPCSATGTGSPGAD